MAHFSKDDYCEMVFLYAECASNKRRACQRYAEKYPDKVPPSATTIWKTVNRFRATGSVLPVKRIRRCQDRVQSADILAFFDMFPHSSLRAVSQECGLSITTIWKNLRKHKYHPYHMQTVQALQPADYQLRLDWCNNMLIRVDNEASFLKYVLWTDESKFTRDGVVNRHNQHFWAGTNPHWTREADHQERWSINVWCGIWNNTLLGPVFYEGNLNGQRYLELLQQHVGMWVDDLPLAVLRNTWFQHDGAPPHKLRQVSHFLTSNFGNNWMGQYGPIRWPPRSPDLTPLDFFLWGFLKDKVYVTPPSDLEDLKNRITAACLLVTEQVLISVLEDMYKRLESCIVMEGRHIEHIL